MNRRSQIGLDLTSVLIRNKVRTIEDEVKKEFWIKCNKFIRLTSARLNKEVLDF